MLGTSKAGACALLSWLKRNPQEILDTTYSLLVDGPCDATGRGRGVFAKELLQLLRIEPLGYHWGRGAEKSWEDTGIEEGDVVPAAYLCGN